MESEQIQEQLSVAWEFIYHIHASLQILESVYGFYRLLKHNDSKLLGGPQLVLKGLYFSVWMIYGIVGKQYTYALPIYVGIALFQMLLYLIIIRQWDYIVYQFTVIINTSWYMRQTTLDDLYLGSTIVSVLLMVCPVYQIYKALTTKDYSYLSRYCCFTGILEASCYLIYSYHKNQPVISLAALIKILIMVAMDVIIRKQMKDIHFKPQKKLD